MTLHRFSWVSRLQTRLLSTAILSLAGAGAVLIGNTAMGDASATDRQREIR